MNYIKEINAFMDWLETNPLDATTQSLWFHLMAIANKSGWPEWFAVANLTLMARLGISENTLVKHRNILVQKGRIEYKSQGKQKPGKYRIIPFTSNFEVNHEVIEDITSKIEVNPEVTKRLTSKNEVNCEVIDNVTSKNEVNREVMDNVTSKNEVNREVMNDVTSKIEVNREVMNDVTSRFTSKNEALYKLNYIYKNNDDDVYINNNKIYINNNKTQQLKTVNNNDPLVFYQQNIGPLTPFVVELVNEYRKSLPDELITEAFRLAIKNNVRNLRYAEKILISWLDKGIRSLDDYKRHEAEWENRKVGQEPGEQERKYSTEEIEGAIRYIKKKIKGYEGNNVIEYIHSLGYPDEVAENAIKIMIERGELAV